MSLVDQLCAVAVSAGVDGASAWLPATLEGLDTSSDRAVRISLARCARKVGNATPQSLDLAGLPPAVDDTWLASDFARAAIVLRVFERAPDFAASQFDGWVLRGEQGEQASLFKMLSLLPEPERFVQTAIEGCRTNSEVVFRAIACTNPYPAAHFPEASFNQLVLKAIFMGVEVSAVEGWASRVNASMVQMARDFADERRAAGRHVPADIRMLTDHFLSQRPDSP